MAQTGRPSTGDADLRYDIQALSSLYNWEELEPTKASSDPGEKLQLLVKIPIAEQQSMVEQLKEVQVKVEYFYVPLYTELVAFPGLCSRVSKARVDSLLLTQITAHNQDIPQGLRRVLNGYLTDQYKANYGDLVTTLKQLETSLMSLFEKYMEHSQNEKTQSDPSRPWTQEEQTRLESALAQFAHMSDPIQRWREVAKFVGHGRTVRSCRTRFAECRQALLDAQSHEGGRGVPAGREPAEKQKKPPRPASPKASEVAIPIDKTPQDHVKLANCRFTNVSVLYLLSARLVVQCSRCTLSTEQIFRSTSPGMVLVDTACYGTQLQLRVDSGSPTQTDTLVCSRCRRDQIVLTKNHPCTEMAPTVLNYSCTGCALVDVVLQQVLVECLNCQAALQFKTFYQDNSRSSPCASCHQHMSVAFEGLSYDRKAIAVTPIDVKFRVKVLKKPQQMFTVGTPLPLNGACRHYKKSFRWLRFPCCGRAFPCDECHDAEMDHRCEWANRMICGHCSREQPYSQKPCTCGYDVTAKTSTHWEGGKGCRDQTKMSRKDRRKYHGLART